jgi:hypothetical protein
LGKTTKRINRKEVNVGIKRRYSERTRVIVFTLKLPELRITLNKITVLPVKLYGCETLLK